MTITVTPDGWNDPATALKDGTMLHLLIQPGQEELDAFTSFHDSREPYETIGFNQMKDTLEDAWQFAGWDWCHDCITEGHGEVIGWLPFGTTAPAPQPNVRADRKFCDFPDCECSSGAAERCGHPPAPQNKEA